ncbi:MAG TPA: tripartite tricarboxylate transporter substrate binding protein [Pseudolabrys sp.]|jgi:tripartite-type tricarboxylate transporter receptor subunit TctC|nr:tripartite tricarboxylate transporter substrate binding protein [Pseudolabrys sp.]
MMGLKKALLRGIFLAAAVAAGFVALPPEAIAQKYPDKPVKIVLPFGAGGVADVSARILAEKLSDKLGQKFFVENMPGAGGITAARAVLSAPADGYTLGLVTNGTSISVAIFNHLPFDPLTQFEMISTIGTFNLVFAVKEDSPYKTLEDFIKAAQAQPGKLNIGTINVGGTQNLGGELFKAMTKLNVVIVPFKNSPDIVVGLLRNDVQMQIDFQPAIQGQLDSKKMRAIATSGPKRSPFLPAVPTVDEAGVKGYEVTSWNGVFAPHGTPKAVIDTINKAIREVTADPDLKAKFAKVGIDAVASTPDELMARVKSDINKWSKVIADAHIPKR